MPRLFLLFIVVALAPVFVTRASKFIKFFDKIGEFTIELLRT